MVVTIVQIVTVNVAWRTRVDMAEGSVMNAIAEEEKK
jgi:hypothetical protein